MSVSYTHLDVYKRQDRIAALAVQTAEDSQKVVLPNAASFEEVDEDTVKGLDGSGQLAGYVITTEAKGYGGTIEVMTGITADGSVSGVVLLSQNETPGLGANATKESFTGQYQQAVPESGFCLLYTSTLRAAFRRRLHLSLQMVLLYYLAFLVAIRGGSNAVYSFSNFILWKSVFFYTFC